MVTRGYAKIVLIGLLILGLFCATGSADANNSSASVTGLAEIGIGDTWINWSWTNPLDADFNHTMVSINGGAVVNVSNTSSFFNATGLSSSTLYTISTQTVDTYGNVNSTSVTDPATTSDNTPPLSITGLNESNVTLNSVKWTWTNPISDFGHVMIFLNGSFITNVTGTEYENISLSSGTTYEISTHTVDASNNINTTWVNDTATTGTPDSTPPASITNPLNTTGDHWIEWTWTNPVDSDFAHTIIYINGVFETNISAATYNKTGLLSLTTYTLSTHTVDASGNINTTWVNNTATTLADTAPPGSVTGLTASDIGIDWIKWTWTKPSDSDLNHTIILINDVFAANVSNTTTSYNATGLTSDTNYTIKLQTVDITGNVDSSVISNSATTLSKTFYTGDRIWDALTSPSLIYTWTAESYSGFYYDLDSGFSSETMTIQLGSISDRSISSGDLEYTTKPINTNFEYTDADWVSYKIIGFMAERYFAGYPAATFEPTRSAVSLISDGQLSKVLMNEDKSRAIHSGAGLILEDGYILNIIELDKDGGKVAVSLSKDGTEVEDITIVTAGKTYIYDKDLGSSDDVAIIAVHFDEIFQGTETSAVFVDGIFQISDEYTTVKQGDPFGKMEVDSVNANEIKMSNDDSFSLSKGNTIDIMGKIKLLVADSSDIRFAPFVDMTEPGTYELRGTVVEDAGYKWTPLNFEGFYYNIDDGKGTESLEVLSLSSTNTISANDLVYTATPDKVSFEYTSSPGWTTITGYNVVGFMAENYFAGYPAGAFEITRNAISLISDGQLSKVLINEDKSRAIHSGSGLILDEGYILNIIEVDKDGGKVAVSLSKDGTEVEDLTVVTAGKTYTYETDLGSSDDVPIIAVHFDQIFQGTETSAVFVDGIFQISDQYITVENGDVYGKMEVTSTSPNIVMENDDSITLSRGKSIPIMGDIQFKVADSGTVRYYPFVEVETAPSESLDISMPTSVKQGDYVSIIVTSRGATVSSVIVKFDDDEVGTTSNDGTLTYKPALAGTYTVTVEKEDYVSASGQVEVISPLDETKKMSIEVSPDVVHEGNQLMISTIKAIGGEAIEGVDVSYDGNSLGTTSSDGTISYTVKEPGMHKLTATKTGFLDAELNLEVLALEANFEFSNLVISPLEVKKGKDVTITLDASNTGKAAGDYNVDLMINGNLTESRQITLVVDESTTIEFTVAKEESGTYLVEVNGLSGSFEVLEKSAAGSTAGYVLGILSIFAAVAVGYMFTVGGWTVEMVTAKVAEFIESVR